jgi:predicted ABC-type transport system involved in lysophospholipase L1 biosynthesis ATPase subunit
VSQQGLKLLLVVVGVSKYFSVGGECVIALNDVSFEVGCGEIVKVVGGSLDGKTTLLKVAAGMERPDEGSVRLWDRELTILSDRQRSRVLGSDVLWLSRSGPALPLDVADWVGWPLASRGHRRAVERRATQMLDRVGMREYGRRKWVELSHWQQVLAAFARAFAGSPQLVVIDDLLGGLEARAAEEAIDLLRALMKESGRGCGVLISVSEGDETGLVDHVLTIYKGTVESMTGLVENDTNILPFPKQDKQQKDAG